LLPYYCVLFKEEDYKKLNSKKIEIMNSSKVLLGVLGGMAAGALVGILFAPDKGSKTRKKIVYKSKNFADDLKEKFEDLYEDVTDQYESLLHDAKELVSKNEVK
jgi:gas vesicle protein